MEEDRMLSDEILLGLINSKGGGGGGGTTNYNDLSNKPQIGGVTLQGNKSLGDLGIKNEFNGTIEEWNALTVEQRKAFDTYQITNDYTEGSGLPNYSTVEQKTGQKWIDGRDVYRKVYADIALTNSTDVVVDANFGRSKDVIDFTCVTRISSATDKYQRPIQSLVAAGVDYAYPQVLNDALKIVISGNWTGEVATLIVDYVKAAENED